MIYYAVSLFVDFIDDYIDHIEVVLEYIYFRKIVIIIIQLDPGYSYKTIYIAGTTTLPYHTPKPYPNPNTRRMPPLNLISNIKSQSNCK